MPKVLATQNNIRFAKDSGALIAVIVSIFDGLGIRRMIEASDYIEKKLERKGSDRYNLDEINEVASGGEDETTSQKEKNILKGIVKFSKITVKQIMRARLDVSGVEYETSFAEVIKKIEELHYSRLPVFKNDLDELVGMIHTKDLLPYIDIVDYDWHQMIRAPYFIHEQN